MNIFDVTPVPKPRMTKSDRWKKRPATDRYWKFKDAISSQYDGELLPSFKVTFYVPMPKSWSGKRRTAMNGQPHQQKPDIDNYQKAFMDALCVDDSYIYRVDASKYWSELGRIVVEEL